MAFLYVVLVSMLPMIELKGGIPLGVKLGLTMGDSFLWAFIGSSIVCIPLFFCLRPLFDWAKKQKYIGNFFRRVEAVFQNKVGGEAGTQKKAIKIIAVFMFSLLPVPGAGVWTATFLAVLMGLKFFPAFLSVVAGNLFDGLIVLWLVNLIGQQNLDMLLLFLTLMVICFAIIFFYKVVNVKYPSNNDNRD